MEKNYISRSFLLAAAAAIAVSAGAQEGAYRDVTGKYMQNPAFFPGWQGAITDVVNGVGEVYNGAFNLYQTLNDMPAGEYTLTANAFYRCGNNDFAKAEMKDGKNHYAYLYINGEEVAVKGLFDDSEIAPNSTAEANAAFLAGEYINTVKFTLAEEGDLTVGIKNYGGYNDEWTCFSYFNLEGPNGTVELKNADFTEGINMGAECWNMTNSENKVKTPDVNKGGGVYRKTNASPYNFGQQVELPAGKYRFSALTFFRYGGAGNFNDKIISCKGDWKLQDEKVTPREYFEKNEYDDNNVHDNAYLYVSFNEEKPVNMEWDDEFGGELNAATDKRVRIKGVWEINEGDYDGMPENETRAYIDDKGEYAQYVPDYEGTFRAVPGWCDSGMERESAAALINEPEKYFQYVEFELTAPAKVWVGIAKDVNAPAQYWNPFADLKLEVFDANTTGISDLVNDENAPVEYYNLQGIRVAQPENGLYIVKQGKKATKKVF